MEIDLLPWDIILQQMDSFLQLWDNLPLPMELDLLPYDNLISDMLIVFLKYELAVLEI